MADFGDILKQGKRRFKVKNIIGSWNKCEHCDERRYLFPYKDDQSESWDLCDSCADVFIREEE